ncbi:hypothetical protein [Rhodococcoides corynebacterioides]|uniref:hypothetical protein n=1 Tax=Rhodococcoides corynebacterioides TaxID=53972 RepID=UPI003AE5B49D
MLKQGVGFGVVGMIAGVLGSALSGAALSPGGSRGYVVVGTAGFAGDSLPWGIYSLIGAALVGFLVGAVLGSALHVLGMRVSGDPIVRAGSVAAVGVLGVSVGLAPALIVVGSAFAGASWVEGIATEYATLPLYAFSAVLAWASTVVAVRLLMTRWRDAWSARTVRAARELQRPPGSLVLDRVRRDFPIRTSVAEMPRKCLAASELVVPAVTAHRQRESAHHRPDPCCGGAFRDGRVAQADRTDRHDHEYGKDDNGTTTPACQRSTFGNGGRGESDRTEPERGRASVVAGNMLDAACA